MNTTSINSEATGLTHRLPVDAEDGGHLYSNSTRMPKGRAAQAILMEGLSAMYDGLKAEPLPDRLVALVERLCRGA